MTSPTQIRKAMRDLLLTITGVDQASTDTTTPPVETRHIALLVLPLGQQSRVDVLTTGGSRFTPESQFTMQSHRIRCEFWVKMDSAHMDRTLAKASDIALEAINLLLANPTLGGLVDRVGNYGERSDRQMIDSETIDRPVEIGGVPYIVVVLMVPVIAYSRNE